MCRFIDVLIKNKPEQHIYNVGNKEAISIKDWVKLCYEVVGKNVEFINVYEDIEQRNYFSFYNYEYHLDVTKQYELMSDIKPLKEGLEEAFKWYKNNMDKVVKKPFIEYIDNNFV